MVKILISIMKIPIRLFRIINVDNLHRGLIYIDQRKFSLLLSHIRRLLTTDPVKSSEKSLYAVKAIPDKLNFQRHEKPLVSIIIPVFNHWETTRSCLISIFENLDATIPCEVIIADDCSNDETKNLISYASNIEVISNKTNLGFLKNCNNAARHAAGQYIMFLNNDTIAQPNWLKPLVDIMERDEKVGLVGSKLLYPDGRLQEAGGIIWQDGSGYNYGRHDSPNKPEYNYLKESDYVSGAAILIRKSLWDKIGGFDENYTPAYYEDTDLAFEVRRHGFKVMYQPLSSIVHHEGISHGKDITSKLKSYLISNQKKFFDKWQEILNTEHALGPDKMFNARDRSTRAKTLLFIDQCVPLYDHDAGSKSTFQYLQLMAEMGYNIKFMGNDFVEHKPYTSMLQQMGIEVFYGLWYRRNWKTWIARHGKNLDYIYLSRPYETRKFLKTVKKHSTAKLFYCGHDLHHLREERQNHIENKSSSLRLSRLKKMEFDIIRTVDISYFFSSFEVQELQVNLPNSSIQKIPLFLYENVNSQNEKSHDFSSRNGLLFVGGFNHPPNTDAVKWFISEIFPLIKSKIPSIELIVVGSNVPPDIRNLSGNGVVIAGRLSENELLEQYRTRRLVIAPLRYGAGVKGKIVEAMYYGIPVVTTSTGAEGIDNYNQALLIADEAQNFAEHVVNAYTNPAIWTNISNAAIATINQYFSKDIARKLLEKDMPPY